MAFNYCFSEPVLTWCSRFKHFIHPQLQWFERQEQQQVPRQWGRSPAGDKTGRTQSQLQATGLLPPQGLSQWFDTSHSPPKGKSQRWTLGKAGSLLVLPKNWEGKWNSELLKQHWVECTRLWKAKVRTVSLWHSPTRPQRIKDNLSVAFSVGHQYRSFLFPCICVQSFSWKTWNPFHRQDVLFSVWLYSLRASAATQHLTGLVRWMLGAGCSFPGLMLESPEIQKLRCKALD